MGKRMKRAKQNSHNSNNNDVIQLDVYRSRKSKVIIIPRNIHQEEYIEMLDNSKKNIVFAIGPAGTGKTLLAVQSAIVNLKKGNVEKIVIYGCDTVPFHKLFYEIILLQIPLDLSVCIK